MLLQVALVETPGKKKLPLLIRYLTTMQIYEQWYGSLQPAKNITAFPTVEE